MSEDTVTAGDDIFVYRASALCCSVCVPKEWTRDQVEAATNEDHDGKLRDELGERYEQFDRGELRWTISMDEAFKGGETNPCPCNDHPETRLHYLMDI